VEGSDVADGLHVPEPFGIGLQSLDGGSVGNVPS